MAPENNVDVVNEVKCTVDTNPPRTYVHQHLKLKKLQTQEERLAIIERDNRLLLEKISTIMKTTGSIDNTNNYKRQRDNHFNLRAYSANSGSAVAPDKPFSLCFEKRQRELVRITKENQKILHRIMSRKTKSDYSRNKWERDWRDAEYYMSQCSRFKPVIKKKNKENDDNGKTEQEEENESEEV